MDATPNFGVSMISKVHSNPQQMNLPLILDNRTLTDIKTKNVKEHLIIIKLLRL